jgi:hypothetical protein
MPPSPNRHHRHPRYLTPPIAKRGLTPPRRRSISLPSLPIVTYRSNDSNFHVIITLPIVNAIVTYRYDVNDKRRSPRQSRQHDRMPSPPLTIAPRIYDAGRFTVAITVNDVTIVTKDAIYRYDS